MIGRPEWFQRRKFGGWGFHPKTWQGWVYLAFIILPLIIINSIPDLNNETRILVVVIWVAFLLIDVTHIMICLKRDEREHKYYIGLLRPC